MVLIDGNSGGTERGPALPVWSAQTVEPALLVLGRYCAQIAPGMPLSPVAVAPKPRIGYLSSDRNTEAHLGPLNFNKQWGNDVTFKWAIRALPASAWRGNSPATPGKS
jgi:hypothetical protein